MPVEIIYRNRRRGGDRRKSLSSEPVSERRSGLDRRKLDEKLKALIENDMKDPKQEKQTPTTSISGKFILRKKGERDKENADKESNGINR